MKKTSLLPCPFCGRLPWLVLTGGELHHIHCSSDDMHCDVHPRTSFYGRKVDAIKAWNQRKVGK